MNYYTFKKTRKRKAPKFRLISNTYPKLMKGKSWILIKKVILEYSSI